MSVARFVLPMLLAPALVVAATTAAPAQAVVVFQTPGTTHSASFDGLTSATGFRIEGTSALDALVTLRLTATDGLSWQFAYQVENRAGPAFDRARITGFGFDVGSTAAPRLAATGPFDRPGSGAVAAGFDTDVCFMAAGSGCDTNSNSGIRPGQPGSGTFRLTYAQQQTFVELSNLYVRWQGSQVDRALPPRADTPTVSMSWLEPDPAPEPAAWAMMILGFGLIGAAARRRRAPTRSLA